MSFMSFTGDLDKSNFSYMLGREDRLEGVRSNKVRTWGKKYRQLVGE